MSTIGFEPPLSYSYTVIPESANKFTIIYGTLMFITVFTASRYVTCPQWVNPMHTLLDYICEIHFNIIFQPTHRSPNSFDLSHFPTKRLYLFLSSPIRGIRSAQHPPSFYHQTNIWWNVQIVSSSKFNFILPPYIPHLTPISSPNTVVYNTISLSSSLTIINQFSHP